MNTNDTTEVDHRHILRKPYLTSGGTLVIPFDSDPKYHWWKEGQSVRETLDELRAGVANQGMDESRQ